MIIIEFTNDEKKIIDSLLVKMKSIGHTEESALFWMKELIHNILSEVIEFGPTHTIKNHPNLIPIKNKYDVLVSDVLGDINPDQIIEIIENFSIRLNNENSLCLQTLEDGTRLHLRRSFDSICYCDIHYVCVYVIYTYNSLTDSLIYNKEIEMPVMPPITPGNIESIDAIDSGSNWNMFGANFDSVILFTPEAVNELRLLIEEFVSRIVPGNIYSNNTANDIIMSSSHYTPSKHKYLEHIYMAVASKVTVMNMPITLYGWIGNSNTLSYAVHA